MLVDLHIHSNQSDGSLSPRELVSHARRMGVGTIALCDHDTTAGNRACVAAGKDAGIRAVPGVEVSATWPSGNCHVLGIGVRDDYAPLEEILAKIRDSRDGRNGTIIARLNELGMAITLGEVAVLAGGDVVGRPHMARVMLSKGYVATVKEAFDKYLAKGGPAYVDRYHPDPPDAVKLLKDAGATVILAHPAQLKISAEKLEELVDRLVPHGLDGIEVYAPYASDEEIAGYERLCEARGLIVTGGSDFHGESKPTHVMAYYREGVPIPIEKVDVEDAW